MEIFHNIAVPMLGYIAVPAKRGQLSCSRTGLQPKPTKGKQGCVLKSRHSILGAHAQTRPGL